MIEARPYADVSHEELDSLVPPAFRGSFDCSLPPNGGTNAYEDGANRYSIPVIIEGLPGTWPAAPGMHRLERVTRLGQTLVSHSILSQPQPDQDADPKRAAFVEGAIKLMVDALNDNGRVADSVTAELAANYEDSLRSRMPAIREHFAATFNELQPDEDGLRLVTTPAYRTARICLTSACFDLTAMSGLAATDLEAGIDRTEAMRSYATRYDTPATFIDC